jgi:cytochrome c
MSRSRFHLCAPVVALSAGFLLAAPFAASAADADAAQTLARQNNCFKCHAVDQKKVAIPWKEVAAKMKGKKDAQAELVKHLTTGPKMKLADGSEMNHPVIKAKDEAQVKNLVDWILSL